MNCEYIPGRSDWRAGNLTREARSQGEKRTGGRGLEIACPLDRATSLLRFDPHAVEAAVDEDQGDQEEHGREGGRQAAALLGGQVDGELDGQEAEQRRELDDRVESD